MAFPTHIADIQPFVELHVSSWASVYKAYQPSLDRVVLLKVLNPLFSKQEENAAWFKSEATLTAKVEHPNVVSIYGYGECEDGLYFTAEFVEGITLREVIEKGSIPFPIALFIAEQMLLGLQAAHKQGVLHRDLKPENVLISLEGHVKLCDFGFASLVDTEEGAEGIRGTIGYMAPEVILEGTSSEPSDVFAVGAVLYEMVLGTRAYAAEDASSYIEILQSHDPIPYLESCTFIPDSIRSVCIRMLQKNLSERVGSATEVIASIRSIVQGEHWNVSSHVLSEWWSDPRSYQIPESSVPELRDRAPVSNADSNQGVNQQKENKMAWLWRPSLAILLVAALIAFVNGVRERPSHSPAPQEMGEAAALNAVSMASTALDTSFVEHTEGEKGGGEGETEEPNTKSKTSPPIELSAPSQSDSSSIGVSVSEDSIASEPDLLDEVEPAEG
ncbi:MAG: serine/threonine protein kinase, partial [Rhodothermaceae bacterium]|nr:serine/threonine protein kinase [Rhodothermaceae bacterium]